MITYPLALPATENVATFEVLQTDASAFNQSPFSFEQDVHHWGGEMWSGTMTLPNMEDVDAADWEGWLAALRGHKGTFLAGDSSRTEPYGTATSATITGSTGDSTVSVTMSGSLLRGDYLQLGTGLDATLHIVAESQSGSGDLEIWPSLRVPRAGVAAILSEPKGLFRLASNRRGWSIRGGGWRSISIPIMEAV